MRLCRLLGHVARHDHLASFGKHSGVRFRDVRSPDRNTRRLSLEDENAASQVSGDTLTAGSSQILGDAPAGNPTNQHVEHVEHTHLIALTFIDVHSTSAKSRGNLDRPTLLHGTISPPY